MTATAGVGLVWSQEPGVSFGSGMALGHPVLFSQAISRGWAKETTSYLVTIGDGSLWVGLVAFQGQVVIFLDKVK